MSLILFQEQERNVFQVTGEVPGKSPRRLGIVKKFDDQYVFEPIKSVRDKLRSVKNIKTHFQDQQTCEKYLETLLVKMVAASLMNFLAEVDMKEGFKIAEQQKEARLVRGKLVSVCSGVELFKSLHPSPIKCWKCGCEADRWIATMNFDDKKSQPVLNLFAMRNNALVMMTRDHIIPKSVGGMDVVENLRPACEVCNSERGNALEGEELEFAKSHPELIHKERQAAGIAKMEANVLRTNDEEEIKRLRQPFIALGIIALA